MELFRDILTFQRLRCVKYLSDASHFTTLVLRTTLSTGTNKQRSCSKGENKPNISCFRLTELSFRTECLVNSSLIFLKLLRLYHFPQSISIHTPLYRCLATPSFLDSSSVQNTNPGFDFRSWCFQIEEKNIFWKDELT